MWLLWSIDSASECSPSCCSTFLDQASQCGDCRQVIRQPTAGLIPIAPCDKQRAIPQAQLVPDNSTALTSQNIFRAGDALDLQHDNFPLGCNGEPERSSSKSSDSIIFSVSRCCPPCSAVSGE